MSWDWQVFCQDTITQEVGQSCFGKNGDITYLDWMLSAWGWTVSVSLLALVLALVVGVVIGTLRTLENRPWTVRFGNAWVEFFRNIPLLVQIFLWYHVVPSLIPAMKSVSGFVLVVLALVYGFGLLVETGLQRGLDSVIQAMMRRIPVVRTVYDIAHRLVGLFSKPKDEGVKSMRPVWCSFGGSGGVKVLGLLSTPEPVEIDGQRYLAVLVPTAPVPVGGGLLYVPVEWVKPAEMGMDRFTSIYVSMGITPPTATRG